MKRSLFILAFFAAVFVALPAARAQSASHWFKQGQLAEARGDTEAAYQDYYQAYRKKPNEERYKINWDRLRFSAAAIHVERGERLRDQGDYTGALTEFLRAIEIDPSNELASEDIQATREKLNAEAPAPRQAPRTSDQAFEDLGAPVQLKPISNEPLTLHMVENSKVVYQAVGKAAGINVLFDPSYQAKQIQVDLTNVTLYDALRIVATVSNTFWRPITSNTIFVADNTRAKHTELDQQAVQTFYLHNVSQQNDFTDVQTVLRNLFQNARINGVASQDAIVMRGTPDELVLARRLVGDLDKAKAEVIIDVAIMEVSRDLLRNIGVQLPQTASINFQPSNANLNQNNLNTSTTLGTTTPGVSTTTSSLTLNNLAHLNSTNFAITIGQAAVNLLLTDTRSRIIQNPQIRASEGQEATLKIGERIPIATGSFTSGIGAAVSAFPAAETQFQYIDVGVNMTIKPTIHFDRDVTLKSKIEVSATNGSTNIGGITEPIITQRSVDHTIRMKDGEANLLGGILQHQTTFTISGTPGLGELPLIKYLFSTQQKETTDDEIVFLMIPHVVRAEQITPEDVQEIDTGSGTNIQLRHISAQMAPAAQQRLQASNAGAGQNVPASVPGTQSAADAAQQAIANMRQEVNPGMPVDLRITPAQSTQKVGGTFEMAVDLSGGRDVFAVPMQLQYDSSKLSLVNVDTGDRRTMNFLGKDGQAVALVHRDDGQGDVAISASRPPGTKGVSGSGTVCVLTFQAKSPGDASVAVTRSMVRNAQQQPVPAMGSQAVVHVQ